MTLIRPCKQSTVLGTRMTLAPLGTESSSSLQMITTWSADSPSPQEKLPTGLTLSSGHLSKRGLDLRVERVSSHDEDDGHVLIDERERSVLELTSEDLDDKFCLCTLTSLTYTLTVHVRDLLDLQSTLQTGGVCSSAPFRG
jgi:hypothetical protein